MAGVETIVGPSTQEGGEWDEDSDEDSGDGEEEDEEEGGDEEDPSR